MKVVVAAEEETELIGVLEVAVQLITCLFTPAAFPPWLRLQAFMLHFAIDNKNYFVKNLN